MQRSSRQRLSVCNFVDLVDDNILFRSQRSGHRHRGKDERRDESGGNGCWSLHSDLLEGWGLDGEDALQLPRKRRRPSVVTA
mmetsp:Transcript_887/g.1404  ORF Transcript_887/g.1404 Transcript_887/m.1404 type:complete len:82 (-) Transcript_887:69-314(-)